MWLSDKEKKNLYQYFRLSQILFFPIELLETKLLIDATSDDTIAIMLLKIRISDLTSFVIETIEYFMNDMTSELKT